MEPIINEECLLSKLIDIRYCGGKVHVKQTIRFEENNNAEKREKNQIRPVLTYGSENFTVTQHHTHTIKVAKMERL